MWCRAYSVLLVLCVSCLFIFSSKFQSNKQRLIIFRYRFPGQNGTSRFPDPFSGSQYRMENNNSEQDVNMTASPTKESSPKIEDASADTWSGPFNMKQLNEHLGKCIRQSDNQVDMDEYIQTFQQLYKFFCMLGTLFGFIGSDVKSKIEILQSYREGENKTEYETVEKMIEFEKTTDYITSNSVSSGSRTFLRLHRALVFVSTFLGKMDDIKDSDGISKICKDAYSQTLAKFHPWLIQKAAGLAMVALPTKKDLIIKVCGDGIVESDEVLTLLHDVIKRTNLVYDQCEQLYTHHNLHGLP